MRLKIRVKLYLSLYLCIFFIVLILIPATLVISLHFTGIKYFSNLSSIGDSDSVTPGKKTLKPPPTTHSPAHLVWGVAYQFFTRFHRTAISYTTLASHKRKPVETRTQNKVIFSAQHFTHWNAKTRLLF